MASIVRIKRSEVSGNPAVLGQGELAYSALADNGSNGGDRLYIGMGTETAGNAVNHIVVGGKYFTDAITAATDANTASTIVKRDSSGNFSAGTITAALSGNATTATTWATARNLSLSGDATATLSSVDGSANVSAALTLATVNTNVGQFGSSTSIPIVTVNAKGLVTAVSTASISSTLNIAGDTGTDAVSLGSDTLTFVGGTGITSAVTNNTVTFDIDNSVVTLTGSQTLTNKTISGANNTLSNIGNSSLTNSSVTIGSTNLALGATATTFAGLTSVTSTSFTGALTGNASTATTLQTARTIAISGPVTGTATSFNGSANIVIPVTALDVAHANVTGTLAVDHGGTGVTTSTGTGSVVLSASPALTGTPTAPTAASGTNTTQLATTEFVTAAVDAARTGLDVKASVRAATTANITLSNTQTVDGVALSVGDRVLVKDQSTASQNGIYVVSATAWTRSTDADTDAEVTSGMFTFVEQGTVNADSGWVLSTDGAIVVGTTALTFAQFSGAGQIVAGAGLTKTGNTLNVGAGTGITVNADDVALTGQALAFHNLATNGLVTRTGAGTVTGRSVAGTTNRTTVTNGDGVSGNPTVDIASTYVGQTSITTLGTITTGTWNATTITVPYGGTGLTTATARGILYGNGTSAFGVTAASTIDGSFLRGDASGNPYWSNSIDGGTY